MTTHTPEFPDVQPPQPNPNEGYPREPFGPIPPLPPSGFPPVPPKPRKSRRTLVLALVAVFAMILAVGAIALAAYEAGRAAAPAALPQPAVLSSPTAQPIPPTAAQPINSAPPMDGITPTPNAVPSDINPSAQFTPAYQLQQPLQLRPGDRCDTIIVDLDEPRVNVASDGDLSMYSCNSRQTLTFGDSTASIAGNAGVTPNECAESIRTSALTSNAGQPVQPGLVLCVATSRAAALDKGITRKIAVVVVKAVASDLTVTLVVSAWNVPG